MTTNTPTMISIKLLAVGSAPNVKDVQAALASFGNVLQYEAVALMFDGNGLVPTPTVATPPVATQAPAVPAKKGGRKPGAAPIKVTPEGKRVKETKPTEASGDPKPINFESGSGPDRIWQLIRKGPALTSTQIRETLGLDSNIVNTTVYRLKKAGMVRPMSHTAINGDTLYTSTEWDPKPANAPIAASAIVAALEEYTQDPDEHVDEDAF